ncbi:YkgJ family cysteine cluster protein [Pseudodesulfovibrio senegalensis]|nr:YkgJ family cysteine cluster protein [Pseudodesulfovibrio senegalensis]
MDTTIGPSNGPHAAHIFLTPAQAVEAICIDFGQYGPQGELWTVVASLLGEPAAVFDDRLAAGGMHSLFAMHPPDNATLCTICGHVFWGETCIVPGPDGPQLCVATQTADFQCTRCGKCCRTLDFHRDCVAEDVQVWRDAGRNDILEWVHRDGQGNLRIWYRPGTDLLAEICPWLEEAHGLWTCGIHELKPAVCRDYPGTRKHAFMTGCPTALV